MIKTKQKTNKNFKSNINVQAMTWESIKKAVHQTISFN